MGPSVGKGLAYSAATGGAFVVSVLLYGIGRSSVRVDSTEAFLLFTWYSPF